MLTVTTKVALRSEDESRTVWSLIGLAVRLGHALGLHRDGDGARGRGGPARPASVV